MSATSTAKVTRGTTNKNDRGSNEDRRRRRAWVMKTWASDIPETFRCFRCGGLLYNEDTPPNSTHFEWSGEALYHIERLDITVARYKRVTPLTIDRIVPGCQGGTYRRTNIRPACGTCNSSTGGHTRKK